MFKAMRQAVKTGITQGTGIAVVLAIAFPIHTAREAWRIARWCFALAFALAEYANHFGLAH